MPLKKRSQREIVRDLHWRIEALEAENKELINVLEKSKMTLIVHGFTHESSTIKEIDKLLKK